MIKDRKLLWKTEKKKGIFKNQIMSDDERIFRHGVIALHYRRKC